MSLVEQDIFLFSKSITENITLGMNGIPHETVVEAAKLARAHDFIEELPEGYETVIGERGITLSGGQRQRIAIARAVIRNPRILVLDDASSAIDSQTEDEINQAIREVLKNRVSFLITHRIAQIRKADLIVLLDQGKILDIGTHESLLKDSKKYQEIFSIFDEGERSLSTEVQ
jgi:ATP-binding cassette subfamily B protein